MSTPSPATITCHHHLPHVHTITCHHHLPHVHTITCHHHLPHVHTITHAPATPPPAPTCPAHPPCPQIPRPFTVLATLKAGSARDLNAPDTLEAAAILELLLMYLQLLGLLARIDAPLSGVMAGLLTYLDLTGSSSVWMALDCMIGGGAWGKALGSMLVVAFMPGGGQGYAWWAAGAAAVQVPGCRRCCVAAH